MIRKLKIKFTVLTTASLFVLMSLVVFGMNFINYRTVVSDADRVLDMLTKNHGDFPPTEESGQRKTVKLPHDMSPEVPFESRYFVITYDADGNITDTDMSKVASLTEDEVRAYAEKAIAKSRLSGFTGIYRYLKYTDTDEIKIIFLDCGRKFDSFYSFMLSSIAVSALALALVFTSVLILSGRITKPIAESYTKQRRFITDAGHELKTPLTVISANADLLKMEVGENECIDDITIQVKKLRALTDDLVMLSKMDEGEDSTEKIDFPLSEVVSDAARPYRSVAALRGKDLDTDISPMLSLCGSSRLTEKLVCILLDNAVKYSPEGAHISLSLAEKGKNIYLTVKNTVSEQLSEEQLGHIFERFYRTDSSRNSETGGHGIGLSIAKAIVGSHGGKINADCRNNIFSVSCIFSVRGTLALH